MNIVLAKASILGLGILLLVSATVMGAGGAARKAGDVLVNEAGMTLYTFDNDSAGSGKSACNGPCAALWPPHAAPQDAKPVDAYSVVTRDGGAKQWAYRGKPLYLYAGDKSPGERTGDNFKDVWHVVKD